MGRNRQIILYLIAATFVALSLFILATGGVLMGLMGLAFFGGCGVVFLAEPAGAFGRKEAAVRRARDITAACFGFNAFHMGVMALGAALIAAGIALMSFLDAPRWFTWPGAALAAVGAITLAARALDTRPVLVINGAGLFDRRILRGLVGWDQIAAISIDYDFGLPSLALHPVEGAAINARRQRLLISDMQLNGSLTDILAAIHHFRPQIIMLAPGG